MLWLPVLPIPMAALIGSFVDEDDASLLLGAWTLCCACEEATDLVLPLTQTGVGDMLDVERWWLVEGNGAVLLRPVTFTDLGTRRPVLPWDDGVDDDGAARDNLEGGFGTSTLSGLLLTADERYKPEESTLCNNETQRHYHGKSYNRHSVVLRENVRRVIIHKCIMLNQCLSKF